MNTDHQMSLVISLWKDWMVYLTHPEMEILEEIQAGTAPDTVMTEAMERADKLRVYFDKAIHATQYHMTEVSTLVDIDFIIHICIYVESSSLECYC
jgi:hypothetical protein